MTFYGSWTDEREALLRKLWPQTDLTVADIEKRLHLSRTAIRARAKKLGLSERRRQRPIPNDCWAEPHLKVTASMWADGLPASRIAQRLNRDFGTNYTRSAVLGKIHRLGWERKPSPAKPRPAPIGEGRRVEKAAAPPKPKVPRSEYRADEIVRRVESEPLPLPKLREIPSLHARPWLERKDGECKWPVSGEGADTFSCCAPVRKDGGPYCRGHAKIAFVPPKVTAKELYRSVRRAA